jgi:hypothetical protein
MNKHLNNWLDKQEGLPQETTNRNIIREMARQGGLASAKKRLGGKTQSEVSEMMRQVRLSKKEENKFKKMAQSSVNSLNNNVSKEVDNV